MNGSVAPVEVDSVLADYGRRHPHADTRRIRQLLAEVFGDDFSNLRLLQGASDGGAHVLNALGSAFVTIYPERAIFHWGAPKDILPDERGLYGGKPIVRWEPPRYNSGPRADNATKGTLCPCCYIYFPGRECDVCGHEVSH